ncbi:hypothetical protein TNCV_1613521 [Trichonephila clavipes]|nr:hypothetical protein TNCV_1613521 [Trichonephila clavipes]
MVIDFEKAVTTSFGDEFKDPLKSHFGIDSFYFLRVAVVARCSGLQTRIRRECPSSTPGTEEAPLCREDHYTIDLSRIKRLPVCVEWELERREGEVLVVGSSDCNP